MSERTEAPARSGDLLVATPALLDPNFERTVVLVLDVDDDGALGVVLNRPSVVSVAEVLPEWSDLAAPPDVLFEGGPVSTDSALAVATSPTAEPVGFRRLFDDVGIVDLDPDAVHLPGAFVHRVLPLTPDQARDKLVERRTTTPRKEAR